jgi:hypothetical protein
MSDGNRVLLIGFDPQAVPGVDAALVKQAIAMGEVRLQANGFETDYCLVAPDETADEQMIAALSRKPYDCVVVGGGIRKPEPFLEMFERTINLIRAYQPEAAIAFNTTGENSVDAVLRWLVPGTRAR